MEPRHESWLLFGCFSALWIVSLAQGGNYNDSLSPIMYTPVIEDSVSIVVITDSAAMKYSSLKKFPDHFNDVSKEKKSKKFDFSVIGGPHYSGDIKLGLGLVAVGSYRTDHVDTLLPLSTVSLYGDTSTVGFYLLGVRGNRIFPKDKCRPSHSFYFYSFPSLYWGIGYWDVMNDENGNSYKRFQAQAKVDFVSRLAKNFYLGLMTSFDYIDGCNPKESELWQGMDARTTNVGIGLFLVYDSRSFLTSAYKGYYLRIDQCFSPASLGNDYAFSSTELITNYYRKMRKDGILAGQFHMLLTYGNPPQGLMAILDNSYSMCGYCSSGFRDKNVMDMQVELWQHIWKHNGVTVWVEAGNIFPNFSSFEVKYILPNYGFGYRWEFEKRMNIRLDLGSGKDQAGFMSNTSKAFQ